MGCCGTSNEASDPSKKYATGDNDNMPMSVRNILLEVVMWLGYVERTFEENQDEEEETSEPVH